jgi:hypothetical protein
MAKKSKGVPVPIIPTIDKYLKEAYKKGKLDPKRVHEVDTRKTKLDPPSKWKK